MLIKPLFIFLFVKIARAVVIFSKQVPINSCGQAKTAVKRNIFVAFNWKHVNPEKSETIKKNPEISSPPGGRRYKGEDRCKIQRPSHNPETWHVCIWSRIHQQPPPPLFIFWLYSTNLYFFSLYFVDLVQFLQLFLF